MKLALDKLDEHVDIICYGKWDNTTRRRALEEYFFCMLNSEGCEHDRYETIFFQLLLGKKMCTDQTPFYEILG